MSQVRVRLLRVKVEPEGTVMAMARNHRRNDEESSGDGQLSFQSSDTVTVISADFSAPVIGDVRIKHERRSDFHFAVRVVVHDGMNRRGIDLEQETIIHAQAGATLLATGAVDGQFEFNTGYVMSINACTSKGAGIEQEFISLAVPAWSDVDTGEELIVPAMQSTEQKFNTFVGVVA